MITGIEQGENCLRLCRMTGTGSQRCHTALQCGDALLKHIGNALLVQQRVSGLVAVAEKPDVLWESPNLERFYTRLEDEYELKERADLLTRKLTVISDTAQTLADIIDTERSLRLELIIVVLIAMEIVISVYQMLK